MKGHKNKYSIMKMARAKVRSVRGEPQRLKAYRRLKRVKTTDSSHHFSISANILNRAFKAEFPGDKWVSDITYL
ncbi:MAG: hypothetical protein LBH43_17005, partial [Treponema sp.]|nr:hypothetical protein [Treponema sp.]